MRRKEKLYSELLKASRVSPNTLGQKFIFAVKVFDASLEEIAEDFVAFWENEYKAVFSADKSAEWFFTLYCFLTDEFEDEQDFSAKDWEQIRTSITASQNELDLDLLNSYLSIFLERGLL
ncbi:MAG: hypothetical protein P1P64_01520 [Treponemataceae bacterium]